MGQPVAMFEVTSADADRARKFYAELFGWTVTSDPSWGDWSMVDTGAGESAVVGGIGASESPGDTGVKIYMRVDDLAASLQRAERLGGSTILGPTDLPEGFGRFALFADPDGNPVGLWSD
jgi:uncharacterized protein